MLVQVENSLYDKQKHGQENPEPVQENPEQSSVGEQSSSEEGVLNTIQRR